MDLGALNAERGAVKDTYNKVFTSATSSSRTADPIARNHPRVPYKADLEQIFALLATQRNQPQPAVPFKAWAENLIVMNTDHMRTMRNTSTLYRAISKDWVREGKPIAGGLLWEYYYIGEYRPALLKGTAGVIRHKLFDALRSELTGDMVVKQKDHSFMWFYDEFYFPPAVDAASAFDSKAALAGAAVQASLVKEMDSFVKRFKQLKSVTLSSVRYLPDDGPHPEANIARAFNSLMRVRSRPCFIPHINTNSLL